MRSVRHHRIHPSTQPLSSQQRRQFLILSSLLCLIIILFWMMVMPFSLIADEPVSPGPREFVHRLTQPLTSASQYYRDYRQRRDDAMNDNQQ